ncbi:hypothetical protein [Parasitella parasitica]|uniref:Uncharacterized protein n=1 Tax=Parasitella parasitica TaxID=35722 RepID=A0A0B7N933_9FUNG|nr:hypothetical protein [Parasitella parasitica]
MRYFAKKLKNDELIVDLGGCNHVVSWQSTGDGTVTVNGELSIRKKGYIKALKGYEMLNSLEVEKDLKRDSISAVLKYLFKKFTNDLKRKLQKDIKEFPVDNVVFVLPIPHFYTPEERDIMMEAAKLAKLNEHGHVLFEDSLHLLTTRSFETNKVKRYVCLDSGKFESIEVKDSKTKHIPCQLKKGFSDVAEDVENLLRKHWLISKRCGNQTFPEDVDTEFKNFLESYHVQHGDALGQDQELIMENFVIDATSFSEFHEDAKHKYGGDLKAGRNPIYSKQCKAIDESLGKLFFEHYKYKLLVREIK